MSITEQSSTQSAQRNLNKDNDGEYEAGGDTLDHGGDHNQDQDIFHDYDDDCQLHNNQEDKPEHGDNEDEEGQDEAGGDDQPGQPLVLCPLALQIRRPAQFVISHYNFWSGM